MRFNVKALAITSAILWGLGIFCLTWWVIFFEGASDNPTWLGHIYRGYTISPMGSLIGLVWAVIDGFIGGAIVAWVYNFVADKVAKTA